MRIFVIHTFTSSKRINVFHYHMFHGECDDDESHKPLPSHKIGGDFSRPLSLRRNGWFVPPVFEVATSLVVSSEVTNRLGTLPNVIYLSVVFRKLVEYPFRAGDFSYFDTPAFQKKPRKNDPETLIDRLPDVPRLHKQVGAYFELVVGNYHKFKDGYANRRQVHFTYPDLGGQEPAILELTDQMLADYPIMWIEGGFAFVDHIFERVREYFDLDYFTITEVPL